MKVDIKKRMREIKWITEHALSADQSKKLISQKLDRARKEAEARKRIFGSNIHV